MIEIIMKTLLSAAFLWTLLVIYIVWKVEPGTRWADVAVKYYIRTYILFLVAQVLGSIWAA